MNIRKPVNKKKSERGIRIIKERRSQYLPHVGSSMKHYPPCMNPKHVTTKE